jgi:hypothetical protein
LPADARAAMPGLSDIDSSIERKLFHDVRVGWNTYGATDRVTHGHGHIGYGDRVQRSVLLYRSLGLVNKLRSNLAPCFIVKFDRFQAVILHPCDF